MGAAIFIEYQSMTYPSSIPLAGPPAAIGLVVLKLARQKEDGQEPEHKALQGDHRDPSEDDGWDPPLLQEHQRLGKQDQVKHGPAVRHRGHHRAKLGAAQAQDGAKHERDKEAHGQHAGVQKDGRERQDADPEQTAAAGAGLRVVVRVKALDKRVRDQAQGGIKEGHQDLGEEDGADACARDVAAGDDGRLVLGGLAPGALVAGDA